MQTNTHLVDLFFQAIGLFVLVVYKIEECKFLVFNYKFNRDTAVRYSLAFYATGLTIKMILTCNF